MKRSLFPSLLFCSLAASAFAGETFYMGTYTTEKGSSKGIYRFELNTETGEIKPLGLAVEAADAGFLALHPSGKYLYAVHEMDKGSISSFAIQPDGKLQELNRESVKGDWPTHLYLDHEGRNVLTANYNSGDFSLLPIGSDGKLAPVHASIKDSGKGPDATRQEAAHAHGVYVAPGDTDVYGCDLGIDHVLHYKLDAKAGTLTPADPAFVSTTPGTGPRHMAMAPDQKFYYVSEEMGNQVAVFAHDATTGNLSLVQEIRTLPADFKGKCTTASIAVHPNGKFLYVSNRGSENNIVNYSRDAATGKLTQIGEIPSGGKTPRFFTIDPSGKFLLAANQDSNNVVVFSLDPETGALKNTGHTAEQDQPVCLLFTGK